MSINGRDYQKHQQLHKEMEQVQKEVQEQNKDVDRYRERKVNKGKDSKYQKKDE